MPKTLAVFILCGALSIAPATADDAAVREQLAGLVQAFFDAMADRDVGRLQSMLTADGMLYALRDGADGPQIRSRTHQSFTDGLAAGDQRLVERFWDAQVLVDGRMAMLWAPYDLHIDGEFSHCGTDHFSLVKSDDGWKISGIVYSVQTDDCPPSPLGPLQE